MHRRSARSAVSRNIEIQERVARGESIEALAAEYGLKPISVLGIVRRRKSRNPHILSTGRVDEALQATARVAGVRGHDARATVTSEPVTRVRRETLPSGIWPKPDMLELDTYAFGVTPSAPRIAPRPRQALVQRNIELQERAARGESLDALVAEYGISLDRVRIVVQKRKALEAETRPPRRMPESRRSGEEVAELKREVLARFHNGERYVDIARALGITAAYCAVICRKAGVVRSRG